MTIMRTRFFAVLACAALLLMTAPHVLAASVIDPSTLNPVPPGFYTCEADGSNTICHGSHTDIVVDFLDGPLCAESDLYESGTWTTTAVRTYDRDNNLTGKFVREVGRVEFSLSPVGAAPTLDVKVDQNTTFDYPIPGDVGSEIGTTRGLIAQVGGSSAPGFGAALHVAGNAEPDGTFHGLFHEFGTPGAEEAVCAALGG